MNPSPDDPLGDPKYADLLSCLRAQTPPAPPAGFSGRVMAQLCHQRARKRTLASSFLRSAAAAIFLLVIVIIFTTTIKYEYSSSPDSVRILMSAQREDGGWPADARNRASRYDVGVTALAVLALIHADSVDHDGARLAAIRLGVDHLVQRQGIDGRIGSDFQGPAYTHYLATKALEAAARLPGADPAWLAAAKRAFPHLPTSMEMAKLNHHLANPADFPIRWADAGGPVAHTAIQLLKR